MSQNLGIDTFDQPLRDAWWTPGWTAQNQSYIPVPPNQFTEQGFPPGLTYVTLIGNYFDLDGNPMSGFLTFWPSTSVSITASGGTAYFPQRFVGQNESFVGMNQFGSGKVYLWNGQLSVTLLATNNTGQIPSTFTYLVTENFFEGNTYSITVPTTTANLTDIHTLIIPGSQSNNPPMAVQEIPVIATEYVIADVTELVGGLPLNPTTYTVQFAFTTGMSEPTSGQWHSGQWITSSPPYTAQILVGPQNGGLPLGVGTYTIWVQVLTSTQVPVTSIGILTIF